MVSPANGTEFVKFLCKLYPIFKRKSPASYFYQSVKEGNCPIQVDALRTRVNVRNHIPKKFKNASLPEIWNSLKPSEKWIFYEMAQVDETRFREQASLWLSRVGSAVLSDSDDTNTIPDSDQVSQESISLIRRNIVKFEPYIKAETAKSMLRSFNKSMLTKSRVKLEDVISCVPEQVRPVIEKPVTPLSAFSRFLIDNRMLIRRTRDEKFPKEKFLVVASRLFKHITPEQREKYDADYRKEAQKYFEASKSHTKTSNDTFSEIARKRSAFYRQIRRKVRNLGVEPVRTRAPIMIFMKERNNLGGDPTLSWDMLTKEEHEIFRLMSQLDSLRYKQDREEYQEFIKKVINRLAEPQASQTQT